MKHETLTDHTDIRRREAERQPPRGGHGQRQQGARARHRGLCAARHDWSAQCVFWGHLVGRAGYGVMKVAPEANSC